MMADESAARTVVTFASPRFNTTDPKPYFINECCFGDDLANWMIEELRNRGVEVDGMLGQEDFGWYFNFTIGGLSHCFIVGYRPDDDTWIGWVERRRGPVSSILGNRGRSISAAATNLLHEVLASDRSIHDVRWHTRRDFDAGVRDLGTTRPTG